MNLLADPSQDWTDHERLLVIALLADQLLKYMHDTPSVYDLTERIYVVSFKSSAFLEASRDQILKPYPSRAQA